MDGILAHATSFLGIPFTFRTRPKRFFLALVTLFFTGLLAVAVPLEPEVQVQDAAVKRAAESTPVRLLPLAIHNAEGQILASA